MDGRGSSSSAQAHAFGWRDAMDLVVKWRQLSEPNDQVTCSWVEGQHGASCPSPTTRSLLMGRKGQRVVWRQLSEPNDQATRC